MKGIMNKSKNQRLKKRIPKKSSLQKSATDDSLIDFFRKAPLPEVHLDIKREKDFGREIDL